MPEVTVVVVNWNGLAHVEVCLASLGAQTHRDYEVLVIDNDSIDGSAELIAERFPTARLLRNRRNVGFAAAVNQGIGASDSRYIATLNPDASAAPEWLAELAGAADGDPAIGMCASQMRFAGRPDVVNSTGIALDVLGIAWDRDGGTLCTASGRPSGFVFGACGGAALYRRALFDDVGSFDEDFFLYLEDVDLAWRARLAGWRGVYVPSAVVYHQHSASAVEGSAFKSFHLGRNKVWTIVKNAHGAQLLRYGPAILAFDLLAAGFALLRGQPAAAQGRIAALAGLPNMLRKRRAVKRRMAWRDFRPLLVGIKTPLAIRRRYVHLSPGPLSHEG